jgi:hypothetical protein
MNKAMLQSAAAGTDGTDRGLRTSGAGVHATTLRWRGSRCQPNEFANFALYGQPAGVTNGIHVKNSNNIIIKDLVEWGSSNSSGVGVLVDGSTAFT